MYQFPDLDRLFSVAPVNFRPGCPVDFDCAPGEDCPPGTLTEPALDYLSRDYASFRQLLIDLVAQRSPSWLERSPADLGITLLELFATEGDHIAYLQDAVANEAYLDTARQRESAKRHAKLVDYAMHDGRNARTWVSLRRSTARAAGSRPGSSWSPGSTRRSGSTGSPGYPRHPSPRRRRVPSSTRRADYAVSPPIDDYDDRPGARRGAGLRDDRRDGRRSTRCNELRIHTWGNERCCLPTGATSVHVYAASERRRQAHGDPTADRGRAICSCSRRSWAPRPAPRRTPTRRTARSSAIERVSPDPSSTPDRGPIADQLHDRLYLAALGPR